MKSVAPLRAREKKGEVFFDRKRGESRGYIGLMCRRPRASAIRVKIAKNRQSATLDLFSGRADFVVDIIQYEDLAGPIFLESVGTYKALFLC